MVLSAKVRLFVGAAVLVSAVTMVVIANTFALEPVARTALLACAGVDAVIGLAFVLTGFRKMGEP